MSNNIKQLNKRQCFPPSKRCLADTKDPKPEVLLVIPVVQKLSSDSKSPKIKSTVLKKEIT